MRKSTPADAAMPAAARLLARALDAADVHAATTELARRVEDQRALSASTFVFRLGAEWLGLPASFADEVVEPRAIHSLPHRRDGFVRGVANIRGRLTICVALEPLLQLETSLAHAQHRVLGRRLVVLATQAQRWAFEADEVHGVHRYDPAAVRDLPATVAHSPSRFANGLLPWDGRSVGLLDGELVQHAVNRRLG